MKKRRSVGVKWAFDYKCIAATICFGVFTFCMLKYFEPAEAASYHISGQLNIPSISLSSGVTNVSRTKEGIETPDTIVGSYSKHENKTLLVGHSTTVFSNLKDLGLNETVYYNDESFIVKKIEFAEKSAINMKDLLASAPKNTLVIMTCAGSLYGNGDASHRLIIFAESI